MVLMCVSLTWMLLSVVKETSMLLMRGDLAPT